MTTIMTTEVEAPAQRTASSTWRGGMCCDVVAGGFQLRVDEPASAGGTGSGPQPTDLLLASVASCFSLAVAYVARKRSIALNGLTVTATGTYDGPGFRSIAVDGRMGCTVQETEILLRAAQRVCYVTNTLRSDVQVTFAARAASGT